MDQLPDYLLQFEKEIVDLLLNKLEASQITPERAATIARFILHSLPSTITKEAFEELLPTLDDEFTELSTVVNHHLSEYERQNKAVVLDEISRLIKQGQFQTASLQMKDYFQRKTV